MRAQDMVSAVVTALVHGYMMKVGGAPRAGEIKTFFDSAELVVKEAAARVPQLQKLDDELRDAVRKADEARGV